MPETSTDQVPRVEGASRPAERPNYRRILANRSFSFLWAGQLISQSGDFILDVALLWLVLILTGSALLTSATVTAELLPAVLIAPIAGVYVDRLDRRRLLITTISLQGVVVVALASLYVLHLLVFAEILVLVFVLNALAQFPRATVQTLIPRMVEKDDLMAANSLYSFSTSSNQLVSLSLGGVIVAVLGVSVPIYYDGATFFLAALLILFVARAYTAALPRHDLGGAAAPPAFWREFREGWTYLRSDRLILELLVLGLTLNIFGGIVLGLLAPYVKFTLGGTAATYGFLLATLALGSLLGALLLGGIAVRRHVGSLLFGGIAGLGALIAVLGLLTDPWLAFPAFFGFGLTLVVANLPLQALPQARVPEHLRGRTIATMMAILTIPQPVGALLAGALTRILSIGTILLFSGALVLVLTGVLFAVLPRLRAATY